MDSFEKEIKNDPMFFLNIKEVDILINLEDEMNIVDESDYIGGNHNAIMTPFSVLYIFIKYRTKIFRKVWK